MLRHRFRASATKLSHPVTSFPSETSIPSSYVSQDSGNASLDATRSQRNPLFARRGSRARVSILPYGASPGTRPRDEVLTLFKLVYRWRGQKPWNERSNLGHYCNHHLKKLFYLYNLLSLTIWSKQEIFKSLRWSAFTILLKKHLRFKLWMQRLS
jgi:hypothetical protein